MTNIQKDLPHRLPGGLTIRWATPDDIEAVAEFNIQMHSDDPEKPEKWLGSWTRLLMNGNHPTTSAGDFTVVVDKTGRVVSTLCLIPQTWALADIPFGAGQVELVATHPDYRRQGLVRMQMDAIHARSTALGHLAQVIIGIPWYYRQFGYEMAVDMHGGRLFHYDRPGNHKKVNEELFRLRPATREDIPHLAALYQIHCQAGLVSCRRNQKQWAFTLTADYGPDAPFNQTFQIVENLAGDIVGYCAYVLWGKILAIQELAVRPGVSLRAVSLFLTRALFTERESLNKNRETKLSLLAFYLGAAHPAYTALGRQLEQRSRPYGLYVRVPDLPAFLRHITPMLERRLASSVLAGHSGRLRLSLLREHIQLSFTNGNITGIDQYTATSMDEGDAVFPDLTFLQMVFGRATLLELNRAYADCYPKNVEAEILLAILFPKKPSAPILSN